MQSLNPLLEWAYRRWLPAARVEPLGHDLGVVPGAAAWQHWLERGLLVAGVLLLACGLVFFVAANWSGMGKMARFALVQGVLLGGVLAYIWRGDDLAGRSALAFCVLAIGALFALYGQTYQTGADPWQLFAAWALCALPLVWLAQAAPLWLFWLLLVDLALLRWLMLHGELWLGLHDSAWPLWVLFVVHGAALATMELRGTGSPRWPRQLLYLVTLAPLAAIAFFGILGVTDEGALALLVWSLFAAGSFWWYRKRQLEIVALSALVLSAVVLMTTAIGRAFNDFDNPLVWLLLAALSIGLTTVAGGWLLRQVRAEAARVVP